MGASFILIFVDLVLVSEYSCRISAKIFVRIFGGTSGRIFELKFSKIRCVVVINLKQRLTQLQANLDNYCDCPKADTMHFDSMTEHLFHATEMLETLIHRLVAVPDHRRKLDDAEADDLPSDPNL